MPVKPERTNYRDLTYSNWHRTLSAKCYCFDLDFIEVRHKDGKLVPVAFIETKDYRAGRIQKWREDIIRDLAIKHNAKGLIVYYKKSNDSNAIFEEFEVFDLVDEKVEVYTEVEYRRFIEGLK